MTNNSSLAKISVKIVIAVLLFFFTLEISARIDDKIKYGAPFFGRYSSDLLTKVDSEGIKCNVANSQYEKWRINQLGFRGPDISLDKPKDILRIACLGTSETFGLYESPGKEWPRQLIDYLGEDGSFQVINTSVVGLPLKQYIPYIRKYIIRLKPDFIILFVNPFSYAIDTRKFLNSENPRKKRAGINNISKRFSLTRIVKNLRIVPKIKQTIKSLIPIRILRWYRIQKLSSQLQDIERVRLNGNGPVNTISRKKLELFQNDLENLILYLKKQNIQIFLTSYPVLITQKNIDKYIEIFLDHRRFYVELTIEGILDAANKFNGIIRKVAYNHKIEFIDNDALVPNNTLYFADNVHYTDKGAGLIAKNIAEFFITKSIHFIPHSGWLKHIESSSPNPTVLLTGM